jgi:anti-sigma factor RsiW
MRCNAVKRLISPYIDGELLEREREWFESHIKACDGCRNAFEESQRVHNLCVGAERFSAPYGFSTRVLANLGTKTSRKEVLVPLFRLAGAVAVLVVIGLGIVSDRFLGHSFSFQKQGDLRAFFALDMFNAAPPNSLLGAYLAMTEVRDEK